MGFGVRRCWWAVAALAVAVVLGGRRGEAAPEPMLHILIVGDRWDAGVGNDVEKNIESVREVFRFGVGPTRFRLRPLERREFNRNGVLQAVANAPIGANDTLMVMVMAHGAFDPNAGPYLGLNGGAPVTARELSSAIRRRGNRLGILLYDSCQNVQPIPPKVSAPAPMPGVEKYLFHALFFESRGFVEIHAARPGESALCLPPLPDSRGGWTHFGTLFTQSFVTILHLHAYERHMSWKAFTENVRNLVSEQFAMNWPEGYHSGFGGPPQRTQTVNAPSPLPPWVTYSRRVGLTVQETADETGVEVVRVHPESPAARLPGPFLVGDTITAMEGKPIRNPADFALAADGAGPNIAIQGRQIQDGKDYAVKFAIPPNAAIGAIAPNSEKVFFGTSLEPDQRGGLRVVATVPGSIAAANHYVRGTRILNVDGRAMRNRGDFDQAMSAAGESIHIKGVTYWGQVFEEEIPVRGGIGAVGAPAAATP